jgi:hypothetical protein
MGSPVGLPIFFCGFADLRFWRNPAKGQGARGKGQGARAAARLFEPTARSRMAKAPIMKVAMLNSFGDAAEFLDG